MSEPHDDVSASFNKNIRDSAVSSLGSLPHFIDYFIEAPC